MPRDPEREHQRKQGEGDKSSDEIEREILDEIFRQLKDMVRAAGDKLPNPKENPEFYELIIQLTQDPEINLSLKEVAARLGISYDHLRKRLQHYRRMKEEEQAESPGGEGSVFSHVMERVVFNRILKHFGKRVDFAAAKWIEDVFRTGLTVVDEFGSWCKEEGYETYAECVREAMLFFIRYRDRVSRLEYETLAHKAVIRALIDLLKPGIKRVLALDALRAMILDAVEKGRTDVIPIASKLMREVVSS